MRGRNPTVLVSHCVISCLHIDLILAFLFGVDVNTWPFEVIIVGLSKSKEQVRHSEPGSWVGSIMLVSCPAAIYAQ